MGTGSWKVLQVTLESEFIFPGLTASELFWSCSPLIKIFECASPTNRYLLIYTSYAQVCVLNHFSCVQLFVILWTVACQAPLSLGFSTQKYCSGLPCPPPGDLPDPLQGTFLPIFEPTSFTSPAFSATWEALCPSKAVKSIGSGAKQTRFKFWSCCLLADDQVAQVVKNPPANAEGVRDAGSIFGSGRCAGGGYATHSSILAWRILWTEEPGGLQFIGSHRVGHDWAT